MFGGYLQQILINFIQKDYKPLWFNSEKTIDNNTKFFALGKTTGNTFYIINFINGAYPINDYLIEFNNFRSSILAKVNMNSVFLNIFLCEEENNTIKDYINKTRTTYDLKCLPVFWFINIKDNPKEIFMGENQPKKILNIQKIIKKTNAISDFQPINVSKLVISAIISDPVKPKVLLFRFATIFSIIYFLSYISMIFTYNYINSDVLLTFGGISNVRIYGFHEYGRLISSIFLTSSISHLIIVVLFLITLGGMFEKYFGHVHFIAVFFLTSIIGGIVSSFIPNQVYIGSFLGIVGISSCIAVLSKAFSKSFNNMSFLHLSIIALLVLYYAFYTPYISFYGVIASFISGIIFGLLIYFQIILSKRE